MSYRNHLTPQQLRNFKRRCRFTACGEPCDVYSEPTICGAGLTAVMLVTVNRYSDNNAQWLEANGEEISPEFLRKCSKVSESYARAIIARELDRWAAMPAGTVSGWTPEQIMQEAERIRNA